MLNLPITMDEDIRAICRQEGLAARSITPLSGGQVNRVYLVDKAYVLRVGMRDDAEPRLARETALLRRLEGQLPVARVLAFGQCEGAVYQIQQLLPGKKLYLLWRDLSARAQNRLTAELAAHLQTLHGLRFEHFGSFEDASSQTASWADYITARFQQVVSEIAAVKLNMVPGFVDLAVEYFAAHLSALEGGDPTLVHADLWPGNILVHAGHISALLDFEYARYAPADYELNKLEDFALYPNDYAEEEPQVYCTADFAGLFPLLRRHYPALFGGDRLRERVNLYHLLSALSDYLAWRKDHLAEIPPDQPAASRFYMARITNIIFRNGVRLF